MFYSCKTAKTSKSKTIDEISYNALKLFNQSYYEGAKQKSLGNYEKALVEFKNALDIVPTHHETMYQIANIYLKQSKMEEAVYWAEKAVNTNKKYNFWYYEQLAKIYNLTNKFEKSSEMYAKIIEIEPTRKEIYEKAADQFLNINNKPEAIKYLKKYIELFGLEESVCRKLETLYRNTNQPDEAYKIIKQLSDAYPTDTKFLALLAEAQVKNKYYNEARFTYYRILKIDENNGYACFGLADVFNKTGNLDSSFYFLSKGFENNKINIQHKIKVISTYYFMMTRDEKSKNQALDLAQKLIKAHPREAVSYQVYSDMLITAENYLEARNYLLKSLEIDGSDYRYWQKLFSIDIKLKNDTFLYEDSKKALELFTTQPALYITNSLAAYHLKKYDEAIEICKQGLDIAFKPDEKMQLYITLADCWFAKDDFEKTDFYFEKAIESNERNALAMNNYAYNLFKRNTKLDKAEELVLKALQAEPESGSYADTYGCILMAKNKFDEAEKWIKKALESEPNDDEILEHLGDLYSKQGMDEKANEIYKKALKINPENNSLKNKLKK